MNKSRIGLLLVAALSVLPASALAAGKAKAEAKEVLALTLVPKPKLQQVQKVLLAPERQLELTRAMNPRQLIRAEVSRTSVKLIRRLVRK